jgi:hypothetical protein
LISSFFIFQPRLSAAAPKCGPYDVTALFTGNNAPYT